MKQFLPKLLIFLFSISLLKAQVSKTETPSWVNSITPPYQTKVDEGSISNGYYYIMLDNQFHLEKKVEYIHYAIKVLSDAGVQEASEISVDYDPSYQKVEFHHIQIIRDNKKVQQLSKVQIKQIQRETDLESKIYDGSKTAFIALNDIRKGDIIEYDYSLIGFNPVFGEKFFQRVSVGFSQPLPLLNFRLIASNDRIFKSKTIGKKSISLKTKVLGSLKELYFQTSCLEPIQSEVNTPGYYYTYPEFIITEYKNWNEVVNWALPLYSFQNIHPDIKRKVSELALSCNSEEQLIVKIIRFVQDEVRYLGFEVGVKSHQPTKPEIVLKRRFGDCKDKSYLLCSMLRVLNLYAIPVLIHTERRKGLENEFPSPLQFNHVTVKLEDRNKTYYIDPTISFQRGNLENLQYPDYGYGLFVENGNNRINYIAGNYAESFSEYEEHFEVKDSIQPVKLKVISKYVGSIADRMRYYFATESKDFIENEYRKFYENLYKNVKSLKQISTKDNDTLNIFWVEEEYELSKQWIFDSKNKVNTFEVYPQLLLTQIPLPDSRTRLTPYKLIEPVHAKLTMFVKLPEEWQISTEREEIVEKHFDFFFKPQNIALNTVKLEYKINSNNFDVEPEEFVTYYENLEKLNNFSGYKFSWYKDKENLSAQESTLTGGIGFKWNLLMLVLSYIVLGALFFAFKNWYKWDKIPECEVEFAQPIGGWLIILALSLFLTPIVNIYNIVDGQYYNQNIWNVINDSSSPGYNENLPGYFLLELLFRLVLIPLNIFNILLFLERRSSFPRIQIISSILLLVFSLFELNMIFLLDSEDSAANEEVYYGLIRSLIGASIWILYLLKSERVRSTFVFTYDKSKEKHYVEGKMPE